MKKVLNSITVFFKTDFDFTLLLLVILMVLLGLCMIYSASNLEAYKRMGDSHYFIKRQFLNIIISSFVFIIFTFLIGLDTLKKFSFLLFIISFGFLIIVFIPGIGIKVSGARRWIPFIFIRIQPSEFIKIFIIIFFAAFYEKNYKFIQESNKSIYLFLFFITCLISLLIILQPDYSTSVIIFSLSFSILFIMGFKLLYLFLSLLFIIGPGVLFVVSSAYRMRRIAAYLNPWLDPSDKGYHIIQSYVALVRGGIFGQGLGRSIQKLGYLPEAHTDFIFSIIVEEIGLIFSLIFLLLLFFIVINGFKIAYNNRFNHFNYILAFGISMMFAIQILVNISVVTGIMPTTGVTLPFISYGGSSLMVSLLATGLLLNISKEKIKR